MEYHPDLSNTIGYDATMKDRANNNGGQRRYDRKTLNLNAIAVQN